MAITKIEVPELFDFGSDNSAFKLPTGTTAERPTSPSNGEMRFNTTTGYVEYYDTTDTRWWEIDYEELCTTNDPNYPITNLAYYKMSDASDSGEGSGYIGQGGMFNGSSSYMTGFPTITNNITISLWFKSPSIPSSSEYLFGETDNEPITYDDYLSCGINSSGKVIASYRPYNSNAPVSITSVGVFADNNWHLVSLTLSTSQLIIYVDGNVVGSATITGTINLPNVPLGAFNSRGNIGSHFNGSIDQVRIFPTALSSSNVSLLYAETSATSSTLDYPVAATALYELSGNANDTGNTYNGTATNVEYAYNGTASNVNFNVAGEFGNAGEFNGSSSYIDSNLQMPSTTTFTFSCWFNKNNSSANYHLIGDFDSSAADVSGRFRVQLTAVGNVSVGIGNGANMSFIVFTPTVSLDNIWRHIAVTVDGTSVKLYIDGNQVGTAGTSLYSLASGANDFAIGAYTTASGKQNFNGTIDQIRIFDSALNASQVTQLYNEIQCVPTIVPSENFTPITYTGTGGAQSTNSLSSQVGSIDFAPDLVWFKERNGTNSHQLYDTVRGSDYALNSNTTSAEYDYSNHPNGNLAPSITSTGFTTPSVVNNGINRNGGTYVAWSWKAGGAAVSNTDGTLTSTISANVDAGFSIVEYTGNNSSSATIGHGLGKMPAMVITKMSEQSGGASSTSQWMIYHKDLAGNVSGDNPYNLYFGTNAEMDLTAFGAYDNITTDVIPITRTSASTAHNNNNLSTYVAYCFAEVDGYSKMGSYTGTGASSNTIVTGFRPAFVMIKQSSAARNWYIVDNKRNPSNPANKLLMPNQLDSEYSGGGNVYLDFLSNGFEITSSAGIAVNQSGQTYIFMAFAADPT